MPFKSDKNENETNEAETLTFLDGQLGNLGDYIALIGSVCAFVLILNSISSFNQTDKPSAWLPAQSESWASVFVDHDIDTKSESWFPKLFVDQNMDDFPIESLQKSKQTRENNRKGVTPTWLNSVFDFDQLSEIFQDLKKSEKSEKKQSSKSNQNAASPISTLLKSIFEFDQLSEIFQELSPIMDEESNSPGSEIDDFQKTFKKSSPIGKKRSKRPNQKPETESDKSVLKLILKAASQPHVQNWLENEIRHFLSSPFVKSKLVKLLKKIVNKIDKNHTKQPIVKSNSKQAPKSIPRNVVRSTFSNLLNEVFVDLNPKANAKVEEYVSPSFIFNQDENLENEKMNEREQMSDDIQFEESLEKETEESFVLQKDVFNKNILSVKNIMSQIFVDGLFEDEN